MSYRLGDSPGVNLSKHKKPKKPKRVSPDQYRAGDSPGVNLRGGRLPKRGERGRPPVPGKSRGPVGGAVQKPRPSTGPVGGATTRRSPGPVGGAAAAAPRPTGGSGGSGRGGSGGGGRGGAGGGGGSSSRPPKPAKPPKPAAVETPPVEDEKPSWLDDIYGAAWRRAEREREMVDARWNVRRQLHDSFQQWQDQQRQRANSTMQESFNAANASMQSQQSQILASAQQYMGEALRQAGGDPGIMNVSGAGARIGAAGDTALATALYGGNPAFAQQQAASRSETMAGADRARAANMLMDYEAMRTSERNTQNEAESTLRMQEVKDRQGYESAQQQAELDQRLADWAITKDQAGLEIDATNAETNRLNAETRAATAKINAELAAGRLSLDEWKAKMDAEYKKAGLTLREREILIKQQTAQNNARDKDGVNLEKAQKRGQDIVNTYLSRNGVSSVEAIRGGNDNGGAVRIGLARQVGQALISAYPNITADQIVQMLSGYGFGAGTHPPIRDQRFKNWLAGKFR